MTGNNPHRPNAINIPSDVYNYFKRLKMVKIQNISVPALTARKSGWQNLSNKETTIQEDAVIVIKTEYAIRVTTWQ